MPSHQSQAQSDDSSTQFLPVLRTLRVAKIFRLVKSAKGMRKLLTTLYW